MQAGSSTSLLRMARQTLKRSSSTTRCIMGPSTGQRLPKSRSTSQTLLDLSTDPDSSHMTLCGHTTLSETCDYASRDCNGSSRYMVVRDAYQKLLLTGSVVKH